ncbi:restriction endonuclease subunit S [Brachyspira aalborgi]|uniref:Type I restriction modification DNA specificity domain-containing protein n=1 Tax=Brachyspira aalborgi TaxID=29522 RepID=A0A5C8EHY7_9SPIR|nr:restriction endonuclease subunit S [Brachyspira aalborgi]TXJ36302.1 hypothetical protein EPJ78_10005 [Brachyspira aalborgi]
MKINTSGWKEFKLNELFKISGSKTTPKKELEKCGVGNYPYITTQAVYNGIAGYYSKWTEKGKCLTVDSAVLGTCFYQEKDFSASDHVEILRPNFAINKEIGLFLSIIINRIGFINGYAYDKKRSQTALKNESIFLPVDKNGNPDWEYMENTIKATEQEIIDIIKEHELRICYISRIKWKKFKLIDLFELHLAKGDLQPKKLENGDIPLVSAGMTNNGIVMNIKEGDGKSEKFNSNVITIDMFGKAFYQNKDFFAVSHGRVNILKPKFKLNYYIGSFFVSVFDKKLIGDFSFSKMCSQGRLQNETILLPVNKKGTPDFELMENFIKQIEKENNSLLKMIRKVK